MTRPDLATIRADHPRSSWTDYCSECDQHWPCDAIRLADALEEVERERDRLRARLDETQLRYIEATNPGIDMEEVKRTRAALAAPLDGERKEPAMETELDMGPIRAAALGERWTPPPISAEWLEHVEKMAKSHWCAGWDCSQCLWIKTVMHLKVALLSIYEGGHDASACRKAAEALWPGSQTT